MGIYLNSGNEVFKRALRSEIYVDKTGMIEFINKRLDTEQCCICVSRPRRFGKTMTAQMLKAYYCKSCDSSELFARLNISKANNYKEHLNKHNVIYADMNEFLRLAKIIGNVLELTEIFQKNIISELKEAYPQSFGKDAKDLPTVLAKIHLDTKDKFIIIIDEWDTLFREERENIEAQDRYINLLRGLFKNSQAQEFLSLAYLTGILPIKKYNTQSAMNNFREYTMLKPGRLAEYTGFTEEEVKNLCHRYQMDFKEVKQWYDGYSFLREKHIYSPNSLINAIEEEECDNYWTRTGTFESLKGYISMNFDGLKDTILKMIAGGRCVVDTLTFSNDLNSFHNKDDVLTVLIHLGYLAYDAERKEVYIPNYEVMAEFKSAVKNADWADVIRAIEASDRLLRYTWERNSDKVAKGIEDVHMAGTSILQYNDENSLSCVIVLAYYNAMNEYTIIRELPSGKGFADIVFIPKRYSDKPAMLVELKYNESAEGAIAQIKERQYINALKEYSGNLLLVGINYDKKCKKHTCQIEKFVL